VPNQVRIVITCKLAGDGAPSGPVRPVFAYSPAQIAAALEAGPPRPAPLYRMRSATVRRPPRIHLGLGRKQFHASQHPELNLLFGGVVDFLRVVKGFLARFHFCIGGDKIPIKVLNSYYL
jgi:hypothetical protein